MDNFRLIPPQKLLDELREKTVQLKSLEQQVNNLQFFVTTGRKDADFDLFCRRIQMAEILSCLPPETMANITFTDWYTDFWKLAGEYRRVTKFHEEERNILQQILAQAHKENNPVRRQYLALTLILFGEFQESQKLIEQKFWSPQLLNDFATFIKWNDLANNQLSFQAQEKIARNNQVLAFLQEKYSALIKKHSQAAINDKNCPRVSPKDYRIYFCWFQGEENLPPLVRCCYNSLKKNAGRYKIVFIDEKDFSNYVDISPHIIDKFRAGKISRTHFSDVIRMNILEQHGGLWLDSTILVTEPLERYKKFWQMDYFTQKYYHDIDYFKPYNKLNIYCVAYCRRATFIQSTAIRHNPLFVFAKEFFNEYFKEFDEMIDYVLMDFAIELAYNNIPSVKKELDAVPINNLDINTLVFHLNDSYAVFPFDKIFKDTFLFKLNWRIQLDAENETVFREIQRRYS